VQQVLAPRQVLVEVGGLHDAADVRHGRGVLAREVEAANANHAGVRPRQSHEHADRGGLAGAVGSEKTEHLAGIDLEGHVSDGDARPEAFRQVARGKDDLGHGGDFLTRGWPPILK
jgi:hypothetical protein